MTEAAAPIDGKQKRKRRQRKKKSQKSRALLSSQPLNKPKGNNSNSNKNKKAQTVHLPHAKLTLRKISNVEKYGSVEDMIKLLRELIQDRNQSKLKSDAMSEESQMIAKVVSPLDIVLDEASVAKIFDRIEQKKLMEQQLQKQQQQQKQKDLAEEVVNTESGGEHQDQVNRADKEGDDDDGKDKQEQSLRQDADMEEQKTCKDAKSVNSEVNSNFDEKKAAPNAKQSANAISARLLVSSFLYCTRTGCCIRSY